MFRATKIVGYIRAMEDRGISAKRLLAGTQIDSKLVSTTNYLITLEQYEAVVINMMRITANPGIAFSLGGLGNLNELGIYGYAMISSDSVRRALEVMCRYANSLMGTQIRAEKIDETPEGYEVTFMSRPTISAVLERFETEETLVMGVKMMRDLTGIEPIYGKISFAYPEPSHQVLYQQLLKNSLEFDAQKTVIRILRPQLDTPIRTMNKEMFDMCAEHCGQVMRSLSSDDLLVTQLNGLFLKKPGRLPGIEETAATLGFSTRTFYRRLDNVGRSYQSIKDEFRFGLACEYLRAGHMPPKQIGYLLGFNSSSNFSRAFKTWSGQTIRQFLTVGSD